MRKSCQMHHERLLWNTIVFAVYVQIQILGLRGPVMCDGFWITLGHVPLSNGHNHQSQDLCQTVPREENPILCTTRYRGLLFTKKMTNLTIWFLSSHMYLRCIPFACQGPTYKYNDIEWKTYMYYHIWWQISLYKQNKQIKNNCSSCLNKHIFRASCRLIHMKTSLTLII